MVRCDTSLFLFNVLQVNITDLFHVDCTVLSQPTSCIVLVVLSCCEVKLVNLCVSQLFNCGVRLFKFNVTYIDIVNVFLTNFFNGVVNPVLNSNISFFVLSRLNSFEQVNDLSSRGQELFGNKHVVYC